MRVAVIGGGISGLAAAYRLTRGSLSAAQSPAVTLFEAGPRLGGIIKTRRESGCLLEEGPDSFVTYKPAALALCQELGLADRIISTAKEHRRAFVALGGKLEPIPEGFLMIAPSRFDTFFQSSLFSLPGKLRIACERFLPRGEALADESVASFVRRRLGIEALDRIAQPLLAGIYTADANNLSLRATMPKFLEYEQTYGSVIAGLIEERKESQISAQAGGARYSAFASLDGGLQVLVDTLAAKIGQEHIRLSQKVLSLSRREGGWMLTLAQGQAEEFDHVLLAVPSFVASELLADCDQELAALCAAIEYASSVVLNLLYQRSAIKHPLDGFGFVVPAAEKRDIIAASFSSVKYAGRCPPEKALLRVFMGGALSPQFVDAEPSSLIAVAKAELNFYLKTSGDPEAVWLTTWRRSMPQYRVGHLELVKKIEALIGKHPGLHIAGASWLGVGIPDCIESANKACLEIK